MMQKLQHAEEIQRWDWIPSQQVLVTNINGQKIDIDLKPSIVLTHPEGDNHPDPYVTLVIDTEKSLQFNDDLGWNWHKSWNLPNIVVRLEIKDSQTQELLLSPKNFYAQIYAVKQSVENPKGQLIDVGLRGTSKIELIDGQAYFQALRFASTSYNNEGVKFHLLMCVFIQNSESETPKILNATISPPIFVDSRKSAGNLDQKKLFLYAEPFTFDNLEKFYIKRENKKKTDHDVKIENDFEGLLNYLTAPNIRHKVKHPLFLVIKFSNCVSLYFNNTQETDIKQIMERLQTCLVKDISQKSQQFQQDKLFILQIEENADQNKNKKVSEAIDYLNTQSIDVIRKADQIPQKYTKLGDVTVILDAYKSHFDELMKLFKSLKAKYFKQEDEQDSNDSGDEYSESEPQSVKKVKLNDPIPQVLPNKPFIEENKQDEVKQKSEQKLDIKPEQQKPEQQKPEIIKPEQQKPQTIEKKDIIKKPERVKDDNHHVPQAIQNNFQKKTDNPLPPPLASKNKNIPITPTPQQQLPILPPQQALNLRNSQQPQPTPSQLPQIPQLAQMPNLAQLSGMQMQMSQAEFLQNMEMQQQMMQHLQQTLGMQLPQYMNPQIQQQMMMQFLQQGNQQQNPQQMQQDQLLQQMIMNPMFNQQLLMMPQMMQQQQPPQTQSQPANQSQQQQQQQQQRMIQQIQQMQPQGFPGMNQMALMGLGAPNGLNMQQLQQQMAMGGLQGQMNHLGQLGQLGQLSSLGQIPQGFNPLQMGQLTPMMLQQLQQQGAGGQWPMGQPMGQIPMNLMQLNQYRQGKPGDKKDNVKEEPN